MATPLIRDVPLDVDPGRAAMGGWDLDELRRLFDFLEFRTLWDRLIEAIEDGERKADVGTRRRRSPRRSTSSTRMRPQPWRRLDRWQAAATPLAVAGAWDGREGRSALIGLGLRRRSAAAGGRRCRSCWIGAELLADARRAGRAARDCSATAAPSIAPTTPRP